MSWLHAVALLQEAKYAVVRSRVESGHGFATTLGGVGQNINPSQGNLHSVYLLCYILNIIALVMCYTLKLEYGCRGWGRGILNLNLK